MGCGVDVGHVRRGGGGGVVTALDRARARWDAHQAAQAAREPLLRILAAIEALPNPPALSGLCDEDVETELLAARDRSAYTNGDNA